MNVDRYEAIVVTCGANVATTAPVEVPLGFPGGIVRRFKVLIPDGHAGLTGLALGFGHTPLLPNGSHDYITGNDEVEDIDYRDDQPGVAWSAFVCNLDLQSHSWQVRVYLDELSTQYTSPLVQTIPASSINAAASELLSDV